MKKIFFVLIALFLFSLPGYSQDTQTQWVWGQVENINLDNNQLILTYLDYDTDEEIQLVLDVNKETTFENVTGLLDIRPADNVSCDFIVTSDAKTIAKNISVERPQVENTSQQEIAPNQETTSNQESVSSEQNQVSESQEQGIPSVDTQQVTE